RRRAERQVSGDARRGDGGRRPAAWKGRRRPAAGRSQANAAERRVRAARRRNVTGPKPVEERIRELADQRFGFSRLRPGQLEDADAAAEGLDARAVLPTGGGRSSIYERAGLLRPGPTIVVSPLIALQDDQLAHLRAAGL